MNNSFDSVKESLHSVDDGVSAVNVDHVQRFNRFYHIDLSAKWVVGPLTKRFIRVTAIFCCCYYINLLFAVVIAARGGHSTQIVLFMLF